MDRAVLDLVAFYQNEIRESQAARDALAELGIRSPEVVAHFTLGYSSGRALKVASDVQYQLYKSLGLASRRRERFQDCVVFPIYDQNRQLVDLCGLRQYPSGLRYIFWHDPPRGLIGLDALRTYPEVILTDNPFHALHVRQYGYLNVVALRNAEELKGHLPLFEKHGIRRVYVVSRQQRQAVAPAIRNLGIDVTFIGIPSSEVVVPEASLSVVGATAPIAEDRANVELIARTGGRFRFAADDVSYLVESLGAGGLTMRVQVRAERAGISFLDRLDLASAGARRRFSRLCAARLGCASRPVEDHLDGIAEKVDAVVTEASDVHLAAPRSMSDGDRSAAMDVLTSKEMLEYLAEALERLLSIAAEPENKRLLLLVAASRLLDRPLGAIVRGPVGSGKSALMKAVAELLPASSVLSFSRLTPQALYFMPEGSLCHKLMVCDEYEGLADSQYALRTMMSEQSLSLAITTREGGRVPVTRRVAIPATLAIMVSSTRPIPIDNLSRFIELRMDDSPEQTRRVMASLAKGQTDRSATCRGMLAGMRNANQLLRPCTVEIPFAEELVYSSGSVLARRQFAQVVGLISAHAALYQYQRDRKESQDRQVVVRAERDDYAAVYPLLRRVVDYMEEGVSPPAMALLERIEEGKHKRLTRKNVMDWLGWSYSKTHRVLRELSGLDLLVPDVTRNGILRTYEVAPYARQDGGVSRLSSPSAIKG